MERLNNKNLIITILKDLIEKRNSIFSQLTQYAIATEFKEIQNTFEFSDNQEFTLAHFADSENINIVVLVEMCHKLDKTIFELINNNNVEKIELM